MKLKDWLKKENKRIADMARDLELAHPIVRDWVVGEKKPCAGNMKRVFIYTKGEVTANDFYGIEEKKSE